ncbi:CRTAC1 family protein [Pirellulaceae bacterium]|nr:CRTAC1 family protein [Pirellulaceae bacterium]
MDKLNPETEVFGKSIESQGVTDDERIIDEENDEIIGVMLRRSLVFIFVLAVVGVLAYVYVIRETDQEIAITQTERKEVQSRNLGEGGDVAPIPKMTFTDITQLAGLEFEHENGARGEKLLPETMGGGCAFLDYDNDGDQDILLINSKSWEDFKPEMLGPTSKLYQNDGQGKYIDVSEQTGLNIELYGMGCAVADYDNDGNVDIFISALGGNRLLRNNNGVFVDQTEIAGLSDGPNNWSTSCTWFDMENDGDLDLFVCSYITWSKEIDISQGFSLVGVGRAYGPPTSFGGSFSQLYENNGDGTFGDISQQAGIQITNKDQEGVAVGKSLGVIPVDVNLDGYLDLVVSNDTVRNFMFINQGDQTFEESGVLAGIAFDPNGNARGAMGIDAANFRNDECLGIGIGNFANEMSALYVCEGATLSFVDEAIATGFGPQTRSDLTFGMFFFDFDLDGRLDIFGANGHLEEEINKVQESQFYEQAPQLFWNAGYDYDTEFIRMDESNLGEQFFVPLVGRGATYADIDADGDLDVLITTSGRKPRLLRNDQGLGNAWLRVELLGTTDNKQGIGATVILSHENGVQRRVMMPSKSYLSQTEMVLTFGLGKGVETVQLEVLWPNGQKQVINSPELNQQIVVEQSVP